MEEIVRKFDNYSGPSQKKVKVRRPLGALISGIIILSISVLTTIFFAISFVFYFSEGEKLVGDELEGVIFLFIYLVVIIASSVAILLRKYKTGGTLCIIFGILFSIAFWYIGVPIVILGFIALRGSDKLEDAINNKLIEIDSMSISELASSLKKTEADIEIALRKLIEKGENIIFDTESRMITKSSTN
jgi:hypothetical protein